MPSKIEQFKIAKHTLLILFNAIFMIYARYTSFAERLALSPTRKVFPIWMEEWDGQGEPRLPHRRGFFIAASNVAILSWLYTLTVL